MDHLEITYAFMQHTATKEIFAVQTMNNKLSMLVHGALDPEHDVKGSTPEGIIRNLTNKEITEGINKTFWYHKRKGEFIPYNNK